jgi:NADPH:quinone reductase-like Zn-dependent oxidoreductase
MSKAIFLKPGGGYDKIYTGKSEPAMPKEGEVVVRFKANSLNYHDFAVVSGMWGPTETRIPMADGSGIIEEVGPNVNDLKIGDSVCSTFFPGWLDGPPNVVGFSTVPGDGVDGYARELATLPSNSLTKSPQAWTSLEASTITTAGLTAWRSLFEDFQLSKEHTVLIQGTGGVSIYALQLAKLVGARVIATSSSDKKIERLTELGADLCINYKKNADWSKIVLDYTNGSGVDHVIEVGGPDTLSQSIDAVRVGGHISVIGILTGLEGNLNFVNALIKQVRLQGVLVGSKTHQQNMVKFIDQNQFQPIVDKVFAVEEMASAFKYQETNQHFGKICLEI